MLAAVIERYGPPEVVHLAEWPMPEPRAWQIRVRVGATTIGPSDSAFRSGTPWFARLFSGLVRPRQQVLGSDFAGTVDAVGTRSFGRVRRALTARGVYATTVPSVGLLFAILATRAVRRRRAAVAFTGLRADAAKRTDLEQLGCLVAEGELVPVIDRTLPYGSIVAAHARVDSRHKVGALVLTLVE